MMGMRSHLVALIFCSVCLLAGSGVRADVYILSHTYSLEPQIDLPADFGPEMPDEGVQGQLRLADPEDACVPFTFTDFDTPWIALIARQQQPQSHSSNCTFDIKVRNAQEAGAVAAIVFDDAYESLIIMSKPPGHPDPRIPAVFVSQRSGLLMERLLTLDSDVEVRIVPVTGAAWLSMIMSAFLALLAMLIVLATLVIMRSWATWLSHGGRAGAAAAVGTGGPHTAAAAAAMAALRDGGLSPRALRALPVIVFEGVGQRYVSVPSSPSKAHAAAAAAAGAQVGTQAPLNTSRLGSEPDNCPNSLHTRASGDLEDSSHTLESSEHLLEEGLAANAPDDADDSSSCGGRGGGGNDKASSISSVCGDCVVPGAHAGETKRVCTICLEPYDDGDKVRVLPCLHRFHMCCVDQWLSNRRACPVCKWDSSKPLLLPSPASSPPGGSGQHGSGWGGRVLAGTRRMASALWHFLGPAHPPPNQQQLRAPLLSPTAAQSGGLGSALARGDLPRPRGSTHFALDLSQEDVETGSATATAARLGGGTSGRGSGVVGGAAAMLLARHQQMLSQQQALQAAGAAEVASGSGGGGEAVTRRASGSRPIEIRQAAPGQDAAAGFERADSRNEITIVVDDGEAADMMDEAGADELQQLGPVGTSRHGRTARFGRGRRAGGRHSRGSSSSGSMFPSTA